MLITALTCPNFDLDELDKDVAKSVLVAAADPYKNPCDVVGTKDVKFSAGNYHWTVLTGSKLVYLAKKDGDPTPTDYDFKIVFDDGKPRAWVEDADSYQSKNVIKDVADSIIRNKQYSEYCINFNGMDYYANCKEYQDKIVGDFSIGFPAYVSGCTLGTLTCEGIWLAASGGFSSMTLLKDIPRTAITCAVQPAIAYLFARFGNTSTSYNLGQGLGFLAQVGVGGFYTARRVQAISAGVRFNQLMTFVKQYGLFKNTLLGDGASRISREAIASIGNDIFRMNQEAAKIGGMELKDIPVWKALGFDSAKTAESMLKQYYVENEDGLEKFLEKSLAGFGESEGSTEFGKALSELVGSKRGSVKGFYTVISNQKDQIFQRIKEMLAPKISKKGMFVCGTVGALSGTLGYYAATSTGVVYNKLTVNTEGLSEVVTINVSTTYTNNGKIEVKAGGG